MNMTFYAGQCIGAIFTLLTLGSLAYALLVFLALRSYSRARRARLPDFFPPVSILKPVKGLDPEMYAAFASHCAQDYPGAYEILFGMHGLDDPAMEAIERLQREFPRQPIRVVVCPKILGTNGKLSNLAQMVPHAKYDHLLINDSDIRVSQRYLRNTMPAFATPAKSGRPVGMVTALYRGRAQGTLASRLEALGIATDFMPGVLTARWLERGLHFGLGSTLAVTREALDAIGGFRPLVDYLADDYEIGARIARAGFRIELGRETVETAVPGYGFAAYFAHQLRWARAVRDSRPLGYFGLLITFGLPWAIANVIASASSLDSIALLSVVLCVRVAMALSVGVGVLGDWETPRNLWLLPLRDVIALGVWFWSFADDHILWRGERFLLRKGKLIRVR